MRKMGLEETLARYVTESKFEDIPLEATSTTRKIVLNNLGTIVAGAKVVGIKELVDQVKDWGGKKEATILMYGGQVPAYNAGFINSVMARALDFDDSMMPGIHIGASAVPTALAVAELVGGCTGKEFLTALVLGIEIGARLNLSDEQYNGFDPTGISVFASAAIAGRILGLESKKMLDALALAFNRCEGSFQSHISGSLAVRLNQGFVSQAGIQSAQLAKIGMTGPQDFMTGIYGYFHLFGKDKGSSQAILGGLGTRYELNKTMFKKYPSCGGTQGSTDVILNLIKEHNILTEQIESVNVSVTPSTFRLVGKRFQVGDNPRVDGQFNIQYCVANALLRRSSRLGHFDDVSITDPRISEITPKIHVFSDTALDARGLTAVDMQVKTMDGKIYNRNIDFAPGFPGNPLVEEDHFNRFRLCMEYAGNDFPLENVPEIISLVEKLEDVKDIRILVPLLKNREVT